MQYLYYHSYALLIVNPQGKIKILYTPFRVLCTEAIGKLKLNTWLYVDKVASNGKDELRFIIFDKGYSYRHFIIATLN